MRVILPSIAAALALVLMACSGSSSPTATMPPISNAPLVPLSPETATSQAGFFLSMTLSEQECTSKVGETLGQKTLEQYTIDLYECLGDETLLRWLTHPYGVGEFAPESSACIRTHSEPFDLRRMMLEGGPLPGDLLLHGLVVQWCMTDEEYAAYGGTESDRLELNCVFRDGAGPPLVRIREHEGDDSALIDAYNREIQACRN